MRTFGDASGRHHYHIAQNDAALIITGRRPLSDKADVEKFAGRVRAD